MKRDIDYNQAQKAAEVSSMEDIRNPGGYLVAKLTTGRNIVEIKDKRWVTRIEFRCGCEPIIIHERVS